ncbi:MAG: sialate O-acetylesterase [Spirochaetales bacterium]|nr:sialate O-acetylesterase [Spirochaetales bacterium]
MRFLYGDKPFIHYPLTLFAITAAAVLVGLTGCLSVKSGNIITQNISPASLFSNNMVVQAGKPVPVWGTAQAGKTVLVTFAGQEKKALADENGKWRVTLDPIDVSFDPGEMTVDYLPAEGDSIEGNGELGRRFGNVLVGEIWFCSGQSNMAMGMSGIADRRNELRDTDYPAVRLFLIPENASPFPRETVSSIWVESNRDNVVSLGWKGFSAVAYTFGRKLYNELRIPVGLIVSAYSGSAIEPWIPEEALKSTPALSRYFDELVAADKAYDEEKKKNGDAKHPFEGIYEYARLKPETLYNAMIAPVVPLALRGFLWYQGESNVGDGMIYSDKLKALIAGWRSVFGQGNVPFYYVQLPPYDYGNEGILPRMWEAQEACLAVENTAMAVTVDVGELKDIHPSRKREVGERLALLAMKHLYGKTGLVSSGPVFREMTISGGTAVIHFDHTGSGLVSVDGKPLSAFTIAGPDMSFVPAEAVIEGDTVIVRGVGVEHPAAVRYAWSGTASPGLFNREGLPARPFRTDKGE